MVKKVEISVEVSKRNSVRCAKCKKLIGTNSVKIKEKNINQFFHLLCYSPSKRERIEEKNILYSRNARNNPQFKNWLLAWNEQFTSAEVKQLRNLTNKAIPSIRVQGYWKRTWIEVLKFIKPCELCKSIMKVNKMFYQLANEDEVWREHCLRTWGVTSKTGSYKRCFVQNLMKRCYCCNRIAGEPCSLLRKSVCLECLQFNPSMFVYDTKRIKWRYGVPASCLDLKFNSQGKTYYFMVEKAVINFRLNNKKELLSELKSKLGGHQIVHDIESIPVDASNFFDFHKRSESVFFYKNHLRPPLWSNWLLDAERFVKARTGGKSFIKELIYAAKHTLNFSLECIEVEEWIEICS